MQSCIISFSCFIVVIAIIEVMFSGLVIGYCVLGLVIGYCVLGVVIGYCVLGVVMQKQEQHQQNQRQ